MSETPSSPDEKKPSFGIVGIIPGFGGAGAGGGLGLNAPGTGPKVKSFAGSATPSGFAVSEELRSAWARMCDDDDPIHFVIGGYTADNKGLELKVAGEGRLSDFKQALADNLGDNIGWGGFRCYGVDNRGSVLSKRAKHVFVQYMPETAGTLKKAKMGSQKGSVKAALDKAHLDVVVENLNTDLEKTDLVTKLQAATGAHKPNGYEFDAGEFVNADYYERGIGADAK